MKTLYENLGGTYHEENGHFIPDIALPERIDYQMASMDGCTLNTSRATVAEGTPLC